MIEICVKLCLHVTFLDPIVITTVIKCVLFIVIRAMAYLHCRIWTRIQNQIQTPNPIVTLYYVECSHCTQSDSDSNPNY